MDESTQNFTNATPLNLPEFQSTNTPIPPPTKKRIKLDDIYLIFSVCGFVLSLGFMVTSQNFTSTSDAKITRELVLSPTPATSVVADTIKMPKAYKEEKVPSTIFENINIPAGIPTDGKDEYVKNQIIKFYVYKDVLQDNNPTASSSLTPNTFKDIQDGVGVMEPLIVNNLLSHAFFDYIQVKFTGMSDEDTLKQRYGDLNTKAKSIIKRYQQLFVEGNYTPNQIIDVSNKDEELLTLNDREKNQIVENYDSTKNIFTDDGFSDFLFSQPENQLSDIYILKDEKATPYAYVIVYPTKFMIKKYKTLNQLLTDRSNNFSY